MFVGVYLGSRWSPVPSCIFFQCRSCVLNLIFPLLFLMFMFYSRPVPTVFFWFWRSLCDPYTLPSFPFNSGAFFGSFDNAVDSWFPICQIVVQTPIQLHKYTFSDHPRSLLFVKIQNTCMCCHLAKRCGQRALFGFVVLHTVTSVMKGCQNTHLFDVIN